MKTRIVHRRRSVRSYSADPKYHYEFNLAFTDVKRQHYVAQSYLRRFADAKAEVDAFDIETEQAFRANVKNVAVENGFNNILLPNGVVASTESWLSRLEDLAAPILDMLAEAPDTVTALSKRNERDLARYLAAQRLRVPAFREEMKRTRTFLVEKFKQMGQAYLRNTLPKAEAREVWEDWSKKPDEWWLQEEEPHQDSETAAFLLAEVEGLSNILRAMPWRLGNTQLLLFTSDNPLARFFPSTHFPGDTGSFFEHVYFFPVTPNLLLRIGPIWRDLPDRPTLQGHRLRSDFSDWESSIARHVIGTNATRFLYGSGPYVYGACALDCLVKYNDAKLRSAVRFEDFDPSRPGEMLLGPELRQLLGRTADSPDIERLHDKFADFDDGRLPLRGLLRCVPAMLVLVESPDASAAKREGIRAFVHAAYGGGSPQAVRRAAKLVRFELASDSFSRYLERTGKTERDVIQGMLARARSDARRSE